MISLLHRENWHVFLPLPFPGLSAGEKVPPPTVTAAPCGWLHTLCPGTLHSLVCRKATVASCMDSSFHLALSSPWSGGQGISVRSTQTCDLLNPGQLLQV